MPLYLYTAILPCCHAAILLHLCTITSLHCEGVTLIFGSLAILLYYYTLHFYTAKLNVLLPNCHTATLIHAIYSLAILPYPYIAIRLYCYTATLLYIILTHDYTDILAHCYSDIVLYHYIYTIISIYCCTATLI